MSERDWLSRPATVIFAASILVICLVFAGDKVLQGWERVHEANAAYQKNAEADRDKSADEIAEDCQNPDVIFRDCVRENLETHYQDQATNEDLQAQQDMAYWAFWLLVASALGIIVSCFGVILLIRSISLGREANEKASDAVNAANDANNIMRAEQRPWVTLNWQVSCEFVETGPRSYNLKWHYNFANKGKSPAFNVRISYGVHRHDWRYVGAGRQAVPIQTRNAVNNTSISQKILFPNETTMFIPHREWNIAGRIDGEDEGTLFLAVCLAYDLDSLGGSVGYETKILVIRRDPDLFGPFAHKALDVTNYQDIQ